MQTWEKPSYEIWLKEHDYLYLLSIGLEDGVGTIWPWEEIGDNLISYSQGEYINFRFPKPVRIMTLCPICHRPLHEIVYISPLWTWKNYCGREGDLIYCPHCRIQWSFDCKALN